MFKKLILVLSLTLILSSCANYSKEELIGDLDAYLTNLETYKFRDNNNTKYYSYYLPSDTTEKNYENEFVVFSYNNSRMVLNINIPSIINAKYFSEHILDDEGFFDEKKLIYSHKDSYFDINDEEINYVMSIYDYDDYMLLHLYSEKINMYAYSLKEETLISAKHMMLIARSVSIDEDMFLNNYSPKNDALYERKPVDLFQYVIPEEGYLQDLVNSSSNKQK